MVFCSEDGSEICCATTTAFYLVLLDKSRDESNIMMPKAPNACRAPAEVMLSVLSLEFEP